MVAAKIKAKDKQTDANNTIRIDDNLSLLTSAAIYGANASGKSNLIKAISFMRNFVLMSVQMTERSEGIPIETFLLNTITSIEPALFEIVFIIEDRKYRYGFEIDNKSVRGEWLFLAGSRKEIRLYTRDENGIRRGRMFSEGKALEDKTRRNALYLTVVSQFNGPISQAISKWFQNFSVISGLDDTDYQRFTLEQFKNVEQQRAITGFVKSFDVGIDDIQKKEIDTSSLTFAPGVPEEFQKIIQKTSEKAIAIQTIHKIYDANNVAVSNVPFDLINNESNGTQKLFFLAAPILVTLSNGLVLVIDELEARFHPIITCELIKLFNNPMTNPKHAQLIFTTHDTNLLSNKRFRRDQIWFTEKNKYGVSDLYSLSEIKIRNDSSFENDYIEGKYGAIPFIGSYHYLPMENQQ